MKRIYFLVLMAAFSALLASGCSGKKVDESDPAALYQEAEEDIKSDHYQIAIDKLRTVKNKFPYSKYSTDAQLRIADVYYMQESYADAAATYESFRDLHPNHEKVPYAMYRIGLSYYNDAPGQIARDQASAQKAMDAFEAFLRKYPQAPEAQDARQKANDSRRILSEKELYIANFYYKRDFYDSAKSRYEKIVSLYPETAAAKEAKEKLEKIAKIQEEEKKEDSKKNG